ncbi:MAG TPA: hypothetical protein DCY13_04355, partial [Verrucomicrobiales bacterium]|nr:hypothetical protein [Verrucomicrobiales bacterium]
GTILSHSGELRTADVDITVPSPRMPIAITRVIGNQDTYEGPFGVGWDFNYNQRLTVLDPLTFPAGLQMPLVVRDEAENSEIAGSQDVLFNDGQGRVFHFVWKGTNMPPEYAADPLVQEFEYEGRVSDYYLPQRGLFNLLVKFKDGRFERLTPSGMRYRYTETGRLETVIDTFPANRHDLQYDRNGWLVRIDDRSVEAPRFVELGHYRRRDSDPDFVPGLDEVTSNSYLEGLICRLRDYTGRDVLFEYDAAGFLIKRLDVEVSGANGGFSGRAETHYDYVNCRLATIKASADGTPYVSAVNATSSTGEPVAQATSGNYGNADISIDVENSAKTVATQSSGVRLGDDSQVQRSFDNRGHVKSTTISGGGGPAVTEVRSNSVDGLLLYIMHPEGNSERREYDSGNPIFRSRANLKRITVDPGPRGGEGYSLTYNHDPRYNLESGPQVNANGFTINIRLRSDGRAPEVTDFGGGFRRTVLYNDRGQVVRTVDEKGVEHTIAHDSSTGFMRSRTVGDITYTMGYDGSIAAKLGRPTRISQPLGAPTLTTYDERTLPVGISRGE